MRPHIICHMCASIDGKTDGAALRGVGGSDEYEATGSALNGDAWICGRITMQQHFAEKGPFVSRSNIPAGRRPVHVAKRAGSYAIAVDTHGSLRWRENEISGDHIICVVSESAPEDYLSMLEEKAISYVVAGTPAVDLGRAVDLLGEHFGIRRLLLEGGGHINGGFLQAGLVDEVSLLLVPGVDGRHDVPAVFDGVNPLNSKAVPLSLVSVERRKNDALWIRYKVR